MLSTQHTKLLQCTNRSPSWVDLIIVMQNPTDCTSCPAGYTFKKEFQDCTGTCTKHFEFGQTNTFVAKGPPPGPGISFSKWQAKGWDKGSKVGKWPTPQGIVEMAKSLLGM